MFFQRLLLICFSIVLMSCQSEKKQVDNQQIIRDFYLELNNSNLTRASTYLHDSIIVSEAQFTQAETKDEWFTQFKWDSVFNPTYKILELKETDGKVEVIVSKECERIRFLHDSATIYKVEYEFLDGKIKKDNTFEYVVFDFEKWQSRRDSLLAWIDLNHPELPDFIFDQTIEGGQNYLKAIEFYENEK